ncbi:MAG: Unknown protein [uncultured Sulfurovum sp.]|uniref:Uncharacterized protein n=1 Tax=uncultured Sulfurovum sp. TaxID=269237 RepID=A0A6S6SD65_9BACT|nr:MAG: Unknown protein [uncultured Sulfurovum sp.]
MKRFMKLMSVVLVLGAVATASDLGGNPEVSIKKSNPMDTNYCDIYMKLLGMCRSSNNILQLTL